MDDSKTIIIIDSNASKALKLAAATTGYSARGLVRMHYRFFLFAGKLHENQVVNTVVNS